MEFLNYFQVIVVQSKEATNLWARGIVSKKNIWDSSFEIYLIDSQVN